MKKLLIYILIPSLLVAFKLNGQNNGALHIEYNEGMKIQEYTDKINNNHIDLSFGVFSEQDSKVTTYNFKIDNINNSFSESKFREIRDIISKKEIKNIEILTVKDLSKLSPCDLHFLVSDTVNIFLIKKEDNIYYRYRLKYFSTQRGWSYVNTN